MRIRRLAAVAALAAAVAAPAASAATGGPAFGLRPVGQPSRGYFIYSLAPGATKTGAIVVTNTGTATGTVRLFAADGATGRTTGTIYLTDTKPSRAGAWIRLAASHVTLAPQTARSVSFTVHVPSGQSPGEWVGGLVAESIVPAHARKSNGKAGVQIRVRDQTIIAVQVDVPGRLQPALSVGDATTAGQGGFQYLVLHVANNGNVLAHGTGSASITKNGAPVATLPFRMDTFLPQTAVDLPILLEKALGAGSYSAHVTLHYHGGGRERTLTATRPLVVAASDVAKVYTSAAPTQRPAVASSGGTTSWGLIGGIAAAAAVLLLLVALLLVRRRRPSAAGVDAATAPPIERAEPEPAAEPSAVADLPARVEPEPAPPPPQEAPPEQAGCRHYWEVAYDRGELGADGVWRFPHRCRNCGREVLAENIEDAGTRAAAASL